MATKIDVGFSRDIACIQAMSKLFLPSALDWEALRRLLARVVVVLELLGRCGFELYLEDDQVVGFRHGSGLVYRPFPADREEER
jgi:hypothetical protein